MCGCKSSNPISIDNKQLDEIEQALGFGRKTAHEIDYLFRRCSNGFQLSENGLNKAIDGLKLTSLKELISLGTSEFVSKFKEGDSYKTKQLIVYGILHCNSSIENKASTIWGLFDQDLTDSLPLPKFKALVDEVVSCCVDVPNGLLNRSEKKHDRPREYLYNLAKRKSKFVADFCTEFRNKDASLDAVTLEQYIQQMRTDPRTQDLMDPTLLRERVSEIPYMEERLQGQGAFAAILNKGVTS